MKLAFAADHAGFDLKERLRAHAVESGHDVLDLGTRSLDSVDYPDFGADCARAVVAGRADLGVIVCGTGLGIAMAANKVKGCRAAPCHDHFTAQMARRHNDANVVAIGARVVGDGVAFDILDTFLATPFDGGRHVARVGKLRALDENGGRPS
jgi:RpiB/LacA/LacB family sugar-phosphate isomerase